METNLESIIEEIKTGIADKIKHLPHSAKIDVLDNLEVWCGNEIGLLEDEEDEENNV